MPRSPRIEYPGAIYHVMNRGDHLEPIFRDDQDRYCFINTLGQTAQSAGWLIHGFVLMSNHYHLLLETPRPNLVSGMQQLNSTYTQRYNSRHKTRGHLFQGRYKALLIDPENPGYFLTVSDYIHMNPVRIKKVKTLQELLKDPWNSAGWLTTGSKSKKSPPWLAWQRVYGELELNRQTAKSRRIYLKHLQEQIDYVADQKGWDKIRRGWCFGDVAFVDKMKDRLSKMLEYPRHAESWSGQSVEETEEKRAEKLLIRALRKWGMESLGQANKSERHLLAMWIRSNSRVKVDWLVKMFGARTAGGMRNRIWRIQQRLQSEKHLRTRWRKLAELVGM